MIRRRYSGAYGGWVLGIGGLLLPFSPTPSTKGGQLHITDWDAEQLWRTYVQLSEAEAAFRIHKSELSIRPIWHQREDRVQAHILVCFLAYVLWKTLEQWQSRAGLGNSPRTILDELGRIQSTDVVLPLAEDPSRKLRIRCVVRPDGPGHAAGPARSQTARTSPSNLG
jgi:hypothetical protein